MEKQEVNKPKWLSKLEKESWQAELVVSGVAIYGSLQLPGFLDWMADAVFGWFSDDVILVLSLFFTYSYVMAYVLITAFLVHFIVRAVWIGMVGLNSVFPGGINSEKSNYPKKFIERFKKEYAYKQNVIQSLDDFCSVLFAGCAYFVLIFFVIDIDVFIGLGVWEFLRFIFSDNIATYVIKGGVLFFMIFSGLAILMNFKPLRGTAFANKFHYPFFIWGNRVLLHVFFRPVYHIGFTFMTNFSLKKYYFWTFSFMLFVMVLSFTRLANSTAILYSKSGTHELVYNRPDRMISKNYENLRTEKHGRILSAVIESDHISGPTMKVFIPIFRNEKTLQHEVCGEFEKPEGTGLEEGRLLKRPFMSECYKKYHRIYVNEKKYNTDLIKYTHENRGEKGVLTYLPSNDFNTGINILKIEKWSADTVARTMQVPFYFE